MEQILYVRALYDFSGQAENQLSFQKGEILRVLQNSGHWWTGIKGTRGPTGLFPANYVDSFPVICNVEALYDYPAPATPDPLTLYFKQGEKIRVLVTDASGWWTGVIELETSHKIGRFPANYVKKLEAVEVDEVEATFAYVAQAEGFLSINVGDIIKVLVRDPSGWWTGSLGSKVGKFPSNFVRPRQTRAPPSSSASAEPAKSESANSVQQTQSTEQPSKTQPEPSAAEPHEQAGGSDEVQLSKKPFVEESAETKERRKRLELPLSPSDEKDITLATQEVMSEFAAHALKRLELLRRVLSHRKEAIEKIERLRNLLRGFSSPQPIHAK